jgi:hypothetical protein
MNLFAIGVILDTVGTVLIGLVVLMVHRHIAKEHKIDDDVLVAMHKEWKLTILGILLIVLGAMLQIISL